MYNRKSDGAPHSLTHLVPLYEFQEGKFANTTKDYTMRLKGV